nr:hypothetical protein [Tanacetum cinerariifolium]
KRFGAFPVVSRFRNVSETGDGTPEAFPCNIDGCVQIRKQICLSIGTSEITLRVFTLRHQGVDYCLVLQANMQRQPLWNSSTFNTESGEKLRQMWQSSLRIGSHKFENKAVLSSFSYVGTANTRIFQCFQKVAVGIGVGIKAVVVMGIKEAVVVMGIKEAVYMEIKRLVDMETMKGMDRGDYGNYQGGGEYGNYQEIMT